MANQINCLFSKQCLRMGMVAWLVVSVLFGALHEAASVTHSHPIEIFHGNRALRSLSVSSNNALLAAGEWNYDNSSSIYLIDIVSGEIVYKLVGHYNPIYSKGGVIYQDFLPSSDE